MYRLTTFGGLSLTAPDGSPAIGDAGQRRLLLLALAVEAAARGVPRDRVIALLWPDADEERGRGSLNQLRYTLRRNLDADLLVGTLTLRPDPAQLSSDLGDFREALAARDAAGASALYAGAFLDAVPLGGAPELDEWAEGCRLECRRGLERLLLEDARRTAAGGAPRAAEPTWRRLIALDPLSATYVVGLMETLAATGNATAALLVASEHGAVVARELSAPPDPLVTAAIARVRDQARLPHVTPAASSPAATQSSGPFFPQHTTVAPAASAPRRWGVPIAAALFALAAALFLLFRPAPTTPPGDTKSAIAVLPFNVRGATEYQYLAEGMVTLLSADLDGSRVIRPVDGRAVLSAVKREPGAPSDPVLAASVARQVGAGVFVLGDILEANGRLRLSATAYRADGGVALASTTVEGLPVALFELVDSLAGALLAGVGAGSDSRLTRLAAATTGSLASLKAYLDGEKLFREGRFLEANDAFRRAAADTTFALANYWTSVSGWWSDQSEIIRPSADRAVRHSAGLAERDRILLQAWDTVLHGDPTESERLYRAVLGVEPENIHASTQLGEVLFHYSPRRGGTLSQARPAFELVLGFEPQDAGAMIHLARIAARDKRESDMRALIDRILRIDSTGEWAVEARTLRGFAGDGAPADQAWAMERLAGATDGRIWNEALYAWLAAGNRGAARRIVTLLSAPSRAPEVRGFGHAALAWLDVADDDVASAIRQLDNASRYDSIAALEHRGLLLSLPMVPLDSAALRRIRDALQQWNPLAQVERIGASHVGGVHDDSHPVLRQYLLGQVSVRLGDLPRAEQEAAALSRVTGSEDVRSYAAEAAVSLRAQVALARGQTEAGTALLLRSVATETRIARMGASPFYSRGLERFLLAQSLETLGRPQEAAHWYATFHGQPLFDIVFYSPARTRLAALAGTPVTD